MTLKHVVFSLSLVALPLIAPSQARAQDAAAGERLFRQRCGACHTMQPGQNRIGPTLAGVVGRTAGSVDGARYSKSMQESGLTWDASQIETFLANPRTLVPGTTMTVAVPNAADRADIVAYLAGLAASN